MTISPGQKQSSLQDGFADLLLQWYGREGRDLPWRKTRDPYRIWVSEIMLQQTGVETVIPYYNRFLSRFPDLSTLADSHLDEVIAVWAGLGYYSRARNLHAAAVIIRDRFEGRLPDDFTGLMELPGIGRSTAGAILAIAFDRNAPILDGNVRRILCRVFAVGEDPRRPAVEKKLWQWSEELMSGERPHDYTQAIMDLGATLCTPRNPACGRCPVATCCRARLEGKEEEYPLRNRKKQLPLRREVALVLLRQERCLLRKRPYGGMLGGLWEFPGCKLEEKEKAKDIAERLMAELGAKGELRRQGKTSHVYSHFRLESEVFSSEIESTPEKVREDSQAWIPVGEITSLPLHGAHKKVLCLCEDLKP
jgi:A/G-specific adenine glycosylase